MKVRAFTVMAMILSFMFLTNFEANATHVVGAELSYRFVGSGMVEIQLIMRRDCDNGDVEALFEDPVTLSAYDRFNLPVKFGGDATLAGTFTMPRIFSDTLNETLSSGCEVFNDSVCVQQAVYRRTVNIETSRFGGGYTIGYQRCCRNTTLTNVLDPLNTGVTAFIRITDDQIIRQNRSPILPSFPPIYACVGVPFIVEQGGVDPDGDELRYRLNTPAIGGSVANPTPSTTDITDIDEYITPPPYENITWAPGFSTANMMNTNPALSIDPVTGQLTVTPNAIGQYLVSFCVEEIDDLGRTVNTTCREFEVNTRACGDPAVAILSPSDTTICDDFDVEFSTTGSVGDSISIDFGDGSPIVENPSNPITHTFPSEGVYTVTLFSTTSTGCFAIDSSVITLLSTGHTQNDFLIEVFECVDTLSVKVSDQNVYDTANVLTNISWEVLDDDGNTIAVDSGMMVSFGLDVNTTVTICQNLSFENGCVETNCQDVDLNLLTLDFDQDVVLCLDEETDISVMHTLGDDISISWTDPSDIIVGSNADSTIITVLTSDSLVTTLFFTATNEFGCSVSDSINITTAGRRPELSFFVTQDCGSLMIQLNNTSPDTTIDFTWTFGDGNGSSDVNPTHTYDVAGEYTITLTGGEAPCDTSVSITIDVPLVDITLPDTVYQCFEDSITLNPGGNTDWIYEWSPVNIFPDPTAASPTILVTETTTVFVTITVFDGDNFCVHTDSIVVVPVPDFQFDLDPGAGDITVCGDDSTITLTVATIDEVDVSWKDANGNVLSTSDTFQPVLQEGVNTFTVMGVFNGIDECMKSETFNITLTRLSLSIDVTNVADGSDMFCEPGEGILVVSVDGPPGNYTYEWEPDTGVIGGTDDDTLRVNVTESITYCVTVTNTDLNCSESICADIDFGAEVTIALVDDDGIICADDKVTLVATISPEGSDCTFSWNVPGTIIGPSNQDTICYTAAGTGDATVSVGCVGGCTAMATATIEVRDLSALITATADPDVVNDSMTIVQLDAEGGDPTWTYDWDGPAISDETIKNPTSRPGRGQWTYTVMVVDNFGCEGTSSVTTRQPDENPCEHPFVFVPTGFSPNGDGENETLDVLGAEIDEIIEFIIYNRWGQEVFVVRNQPSASWDGTYQNDELETDVFGYYLRVLCDNGDESTQQGNINLLR